MAEQSRLAEIAAEIVAAKGLADVWSSLWAEVSPERRAALADTAIGIVLAGIKQYSDYEYRGLVNKQINEAVEAELAKRGDEIRAYAKERVDKELLEVAKRNGGEVAAKQILLTDIDRAISVLQEQRRRLTETRG